MRDKITGSPKNNECGVINLDYSYNQGTHWVCYFINEHHCFYFDSFGQLPPIELNAYFDKANKNKLYNNSQLQDINYITCGLYVCYVLLNLNKGKTIYDTLYSFPTQKPSKDNELFIKKYFNLL
jgi:hypothetical protein